MSKSGYSSPHIVVTCSEHLVGFPPAVSLVTNLLSIDCRVTLFACGNTDCLPLAVVDDPKFTFVSLGERGGSLINRGKMLLTVPRTIREFLRDNHDAIDIVWTTMAVDVRDIGRVLYGFRHIMQLPELTETVPLLLHRNRPPYSKNTIALARQAKRVVVPEYNRAFIQQALWRLPETPMVLPNKPSIKKNAKYDLASDDSRLEKIRDEKRKVVLYQGLFADDRDLFPFADAVDSFDGEFVLYLMGKATDDTQQKKLDELISAHNNIEYIGYVPAPRHLAFARYARMGLLPYMASYDGACPPLNALYCAPNKIWEYSCYGIPMLGSDIPGLTGIFARYGCGLTSSTNPDKIACSIREIDASYEAMSSGSSNLYDSVNTREIVKQIIEEVIEN